MFRYVNAKKIRKDSNFHTHTHTHTHTHRRTYNFTVTAMGEMNTPPELRGTTTVIINVLDANDQTPMFVEDSYTFDVRENEPPLTFVGRVLARDLDSGSNAMVSFCNIDIIILAYM